LAVVEVALGDRSYPIHIEAGLLNKAGEIIASIAKKPRVALVAQKKVFDLWGAQVSDSLRRAGLDFFTAIVPDGEKAKTLAWTRRLYGEFAKNSMDRSSLVVALGGGAVGDLAGFAAASWLRGVDFVQIPTTLLAQVDASVGGKVGVNLPAGKNLVGAFWQPKAVLIDPLCLTTLSKRDIKSGLAEVIKYGIILDKDFFNKVKALRTGLLEAQPEALITAIQRSCELKAYVVCSDERESGLRAILNYGHTIGHAVESVAGYGRMRHGEAISIGMVLAARLAVDLKMFHPDQAGEVEETLRAFALPVEVCPNLDVRAMLKAVSVDKKSKAGKVRFILPKTIGVVEMSDKVTPEMVEAVIRESQARAAKR